MSTGLNTQAFCYGSVNFGCGLENRPELTPPENPSSTPLFLNLYVNVETGEISSFQTTTEMSQGVWQTWQTYE